MSFQKTNTGLQEETERVEFEGGELGSDYSLASNRISNNSLEDR